MTKITLISAAWLICGGVLLNGSEYNNKGKIRIHDVTELKAELSHVRHDYVNHKNQVFGEMVKRGRVDYNPTVKVDIQHVDDQKK